MVFSPQAISNQQQEDYAELPIPQQFVPENPESPPKPIKRTIKKQEKEKKKDRGGAKVNCGDIVVPRAEKMTQMQDNLLYGIFLRYEKNNNLFKSPQLETIFTEYKDVWKTRTEIEEQVQAPLNKEFEDCVELRCEKGVHELVTYTDTT